MLLTLFYTDSSSVVLRYGGHSNVTSSEFTSPRKGSVRFLFKMTNQLTSTFKVHVLTEASSQVTDFSGKVLINQMREREIILIFGIEVVVFEKFKVFQQNRFLNVMSNSNYKVFNTTQHFFSLYKSFF